jgi:ribosomal protein S18
MSKKLKKNYNNSDTDTDSNSNSDSNSDSDNNNDIDSFESKFQLLSKKTTQKKDYSFLEKNKNKCTCKHLIDGFYLENPLLIKYILENNKIKPNDDCYIAYIKKKGYLERKFKYMKEEENNNLNFENLDFIADYFLENLKIEQRHLEWAFCCCEYTIIKAIYNYKYMDKFDIGSCINTGILYWQKSRRGFNKLNDILYIFYEVGYKLNEHQIIQLTNFDISLDEKLIKHYNKTFRFELCTRYKNPLIIGKKQKILSKFSGCL